MNEIDFRLTAMDIVSDYIRKHLDFVDKNVEYAMFVVWMCKILDNNKALISTTLPDGMYYEVTYDGVNEKYYLDAYKKFDNIQISI